MADAASFTATIAEAERYQLLATDDEANHLQADEFAPSSVGKSDRSVADLAVIDLPGE